MLRIESLPIGGDLDVKVQFPLNLTEYTNVAVWLVDKDCQVFKYSLYALEGHNHTDVSSIGDNEILIKLQKSVTKQFKAGVMTIETYEAITDNTREGATFVEIALPEPFAEFKRNRIYQL